MSRFPSHLPRLERQAYQGTAIIHWSLTTFDRAMGWLDGPFHARFRELLLHTAAREGLACPAYCLMPDHLHLLWMGLRDDTDQRHAMAFLRTYLEPALVPHRFQPQAYDHVLRDDERDPDALAVVCRYVLANPERKGLVASWPDWPYSGASLPGYPALDPRHEGYWDRFWKLYRQIREAP